MRTFLPVLTFWLLVLGCNEQSRAPIVVEDATPMVASGQTTEHLGIETLGGIFTPLIKSGTAVPWTVSEIFSTATDGQSRIMVSPFRGTNQSAAANHALGRFQVVGIPAAPRGTPQVQVTFMIKGGQILMAARDLTRNSDLEIQRVSGETKP